VVFGTILAPTFIIFFALPASISFGYYQSELLGGQIDMLSTLPGFQIVHSIFAWWLSSMVWIGLMMIGTWLFFALILTYTSPQLGFSHKMHSSFSVDYC
jgi:hypothetical protein